jgi:hypothetical protein
VKEEFQFVQAMTQMQLDKDPRASVVDVARDLFGVIGRQSPAKPVMTMRQFLEEQEERLQRDECSDDLLAPHPVVPTVSDEPYDSLRAAEMLPVFDKLPAKFGETDYSAIKLNDQTAALSCDHYFDLIALRDECRTLREDNRQLQAAVIQMSRRQEALDRLAVIGVGISKLEDCIFVVNTADVSVCDESLTDCLEKAVEQMKQNVKATAQAYFASDECVSPATVIENAMSIDSVADVQIIPSDELMIEPETWPVDSFDEQPF